ncbi:unnamed protein product [Musa hybrid cultivar]
MLFDASSLSPGTPCQPVPCLLHHLLLPLSSSSSKPCFFHSLTGLVTMAIGTILVSVSSTLYHRKLLFSAFAALLLVVGKPRPAHSFPLKLKTSTISAAPGILPYDPKFSSLAPALAPDVMPVFPTPGGSAAAPPASSLPTIPSSPSPPNPDELQPNSATAPSGSAALTSAAARSRGSLGGVSVAMVAGLLLMWWLDVVGK